MLIFSTILEPPRPPSSDETLASQAQRQPQVFASVMSTLYERHADRIYNYCLAHTGSPEDAQDLTSTIFLTALENFGRYDCRRSFAGWLYGIAHHKLVDHYRHGRSDVPLDQSEGLADPSSAAVEASAERRIQMQAVASALRTLNAEQAEALNLRIFAGLSAAEAGMVMGKSEAAIKMLVYRALRAAQERLTPLMEVTL